MVYHHRNLEFQDEHHLIKEFYKHQNDLYRQLKREKGFITMIQRDSLPICNAVCRRLFRAFKSAPAFASNSNTSASSPKAA
jgi:hypothetical protein